MNTYKEFYGKTLDDAILEACTYFGVEREKLEIEIVNDAKTGIFGLVGVKKACIKAGRVPSSSVVADTPETPGPITEKNVTSNEGQNGRKQRTPKKTIEDTPEKTTAPVVKTKAAPSTVSAKDRPPRNLDMPLVSDGNKHECIDEPCKKVTSKASPILSKSDETLLEDEPCREDETPELALDLCSEDEVIAVIRDTLTKLITPIVGEAAIEISVVNGRVRVTIDCGDSSGILVGREGQTLASVQYLIARLAAKRLGGAIRLQIDVGNYRERQDDRLKELALFLADRVKKTKKTQATRPLSAYQRRIIHLTLEGDESLQTHSKGEGLQRRVVIQLRKRKGDPERCGDKDSDHTDAFPEDSSKEQARA